MAEIGRVMADYFRARDAMEPVSRDDLVSRLHDGMVTVLDVRPEDEFAVGHLPGALNLPLAELERRLGELQADREVIAYCRGPYCVLSEKVQLPNEFAPLDLRSIMPAGRVSGPPVRQ